MLVKIRESYLLNTDSIVHVLPYGSGTLIAFKDVEDITINVPVNEVIDAIADAQRKGGLICSH